MTDAADVAIVGGGPAGAALAIRLADAGVRTLLFERSAEPKWRACGVFSSPLTARRLIEVGLTRGLVDELSRPISALNLETTRGARCRIEYEHGHARGFDRPPLDAALLDRARDAGAEVRVGTVVRTVELPQSAKEPCWLHVSATDPRWRGDRRVIKARLIVGADGSGSLVSRSAGIPARNTRIWKSAITFHRKDPEAAPQTEPMEGRFVFGKGWYVGVAPVPHARVNVGMVIPGPWISATLDDITERLLGSFPGPRDPWMSSPMTDGYRVEGVLEHRANRAVGPGFLLVGDAAGFIDPLTGEGLHRALVSSELAADAIARWLRGDGAALDDYDRHLRARFRNKDVVSWVLQGFLAQPALLDYAVRRLASRRRQREVLTLVLTDQLPASRALDPRFLARLLVP